METNRLKAQSRSLNGGGKEGRNFNGCEGRYFRKNGESSAVTVA